MDAVKPHARPLALEPMEVSTAEGSAAAPAAGDGYPVRATGERELPLTAADEYLTSAAKEYQEGHVDPALWARASEQARHDNSLAIAAYLRARATALRLQKRDRRSARRIRRADARQDTRTRKVEPEPPPATPSTAAVGVPPWGVKLKARYAAATVAAALVSVVAAVALTSSPHGSGGSIGPPSVSAVTPSAKEPAPTGPGGGAQPVAVSTGGGASEGNSLRPLETTLQQLKDAGNWNVLVLYAAKWTRDEPNHAAAWSELSLGYSKLHQFDDALAAATKAAELAPEDASHWRQIGHLNVALDRLPEAGSAFNRALAANSDDADALCGAALVAHRSGRQKDADAIASRVKSAGGSCHTVSDSESVTVVVGSAAATKPASSVRR